jgi:hypothetical protein
MIVNLVRLHHGPASSVIMNIALPRRIGKVPVGGGRSSLEGHPQFFESAWRIGSGWRREILAVQLSPASRWPPQAVPIFQTHFLKGRTTDFFHPFSWGEGRDEGGATFCTPLRAGERRKGATLNRPEEICRDAPLKMQQTMGLTKPAPESKLPRKP